VKLGLVPVGDSGGRFQFVVASRPHRVTVDGDDLLAAIE